MSTIACFGTDIETNLSLFTESTCDLPVQSEEKPSKNSVTYFFLHSDNVTAFIGQIGSL